MSLALAGRFLTTAPPGEPKIDKSLAKLIRKKRGEKKSQVTKVRNENGAVTTYFIEIKRIIRE